MTNQPAPSACHNAADTLRSSPAFVEKAYQAMRDQQALKGQLQLETARNLFYAHGIIASTDDLHALMLQVRRLYAAKHLDTGV